MSAAAVMDVMPPVKSTVDASRFTEFRAGVIALASGVRAARGLIPALGQRHGSGCRCVWWRTATGTLRGSPHNGRQCYMTHGRSAAL
jgi:hypothetical protein